jgi:hypothetical protein
MNNTPLQKYLHDHLAGAAFAIDLLGALCRKHEADGFSEQLRSLHMEIASDRDELAAIAGKLGIEPGGLKESMARFLEKMSRPKLVSGEDDVFSSFEACETLALGILGKIALWDALSTTVGITGIDADLARLRRRAEAQHAVVEKLRLDLAALALSTTDRKRP